MIIALDLTVIQSAHRMRGIGATAINFVNNLSDAAKREHTFVLYLYPDGQEEVIELLNLEDISYKILNIQADTAKKIKLPGSLRILNGAFNATNELIKTYRGDSRIGQLQQIDAFLQFDPLRPLPRYRAVKKALIIYDLIPYIMEADYLLSYKTARQHGHSRKGSLRKALLRKKYIATVKAVSKQADMLIAISHHTKHDYMLYAGSKEKSIQVIHLGVSPLLTTDQAEVLPFNRYITNSWGAFPEPIDLSEKPFILFVGGADPRRRLDELVASYNNMKAQGHDLRLVLAGDSMKGPYAIPVPKTQEYITHSSYLNDIAFVGFVTDAQREWLYANAVAMVYPSMYEGFGLPILEAMRYGTPVITYKNSSITEISEDAAIYAHNAETIKSACVELLTNIALRNQYATRGKEQAAKFSWEKTSTRIIESLWSVL